MIEIDLHAPAHLPGVPLPSRRAAEPLALLARCPVAKPTPLIEANTLARVAGLGALWIKDERQRMGLGSFKALGAAYVIAQLAQDDGLDDQVFISASAGNHGLSVAAGARVFGARAMIYIAETVPESFAERLRAKGAEVVRAGADYEASMAAAKNRAEAEGWTLLSDSSWEGYLELPHMLMEGYLVLAQEAAFQVPDAPTHVFLQAGVGGMAAAVAAYIREIWGAAPFITVVEPSRAPALRHSARAGRAVHAPGPDSSMGRLDCKEPSLIALAGLMADANAFLTIDDEDVEAALPMLDQAGLGTTPSGGAGLVAALTLSPEQRQQLGMGADARVLCILTEAA